YDSGDKDSRAVGYRFARRRSRFVWAASRGSVLDGHKSRRLLGQPLVLGIFVKVLSRLLPQLDASPFALPFPQLPKSRRPDFRKSPNMTRSHCSISKAISVWMVSTVFFYYALAFSGPHLTDRGIHFHKLSAQLLKPAELCNLVLCLSNRVSSQTLRIRFPLDLICQSPMRTMPRMGLFQAAAICLAALFSNRRHRTRPKVS